ncbi:hypothetical protein PV327_001965 [Microctonus hyperodae]|uniref:Nucleolar protein 12 n=1 Tax=Microctonus hyperodae TaxID=165561 RepID=A0AA39FEK9_MICHY|nr:hypothetical protein PV327_001965 [Microctonus hyperodae]
MRPTKGVPRILNVNREPSRPKKKKRKITLVFDEAKRKEFLTGFHKRNVERREKAKEVLAAKLKAEKKRITEEAKAKFKTHLSQRDIPELEELLSKQEYETEGATVSILELNVEKLAQSANWIGDNKPCYEEDEAESEEDNDSEENNDDFVPGMELKEKKIKKSTEVEENIQPQLSKKAISKAIQKETLRRTHQSSLFKMKQKRENNKKCK